MKIKRGSTSVRRLIFIADSSSTVGAGLANLAYDTASLVAYYFAGDLSNEVQITLATATLGTWASGGFVAVDNTNMPGWYEIGIPNAALDGGNECAIQFRGASNMVPVNIYIELDTVDYQTAAMGAVMPTTAGRTLDIDANGAVELDSASRLAIWNTLTTGTFTADSFGELLIISDGTNGREVKVTASGHMAADIHDCQADGLSGSTEITAINTFAARVTTGLVQDGAVYQFTANMLELAPAGGGGGGSGDATLAKQEEILTQLDVIQTKTDTIGSVGAITSLLAAAVLEPGTITSFPETLTIGDSYTEQNGREIQIPIVDTDGTPLSSTGSLNFADASVTFTLQRSGETDSTRVITGTATFVDPPGTGTGAGAPYAVIELPASETAKGLKKYKYSGILTFLWTGTGTDVMSFETDTVTFDS